MSSPRRKLAQFRSQIIEANKKGGRGGPGRSGSGVGQRKEIKSDRFGYMNISLTQTKRRLIQRYWRIFYYWSLNAIGEGIMDKKIKKEIDRIFDQANRK
jgi:hypothetical protein